MQPAEQPDALIGQTVGSYEITRKLGAGGMGEVYLAVHPRIGSRVAIKVLAAECLQRQDMVDRFFAEARTVNKIRHENIVNVLDLANLPDGRPYIIMEYLDGATLTEVFAARHQLPLGSLARIVGEILDALSAAHRAGVVHRDLKPDNIYVTPNGRAKVLDFGIAKLLPEFGDIDSATRTGAVLGTPLYMAPEQVSSQPIDARTDLYSTGIMLFEGATGQRPFFGDSLFALLRAQVDDPAPSPRAARPDMPAAYEAVILRALEKDPAGRFASAVEMGEALNAATAQLPPAEWESLGLGATDSHITIGPQSDRISRPGVSPTNRALASAPTQVSTAANTPVGHEASQSGGNLARTVAIAGAAALVGGAIIAIVMSRSGTPSDPTAEQSAVDPQAAIDAGAELAQNTDDAAPSPPVVTDEPPTPVGPRTTKRATKRSSKTAPAPGGPGKTPSATPDAGTSSSGSSGVTIGPGVTVIQTGGTATTLAPDYNPRSFDARGYWKTAKKHARTIYSDAVLTHFDVVGVLPSGKANLTLSSDTEATYYFRSPSRSKRPADIPEGIDVDIDCMVYVIAKGSEVEVYPVSHETCKDPPRRYPKCSIAQVWEKAIALGAPSGNVVAKIDWLWDGWFFQIGADTFTESIPDDC